MISNLRNLIFISAIPGLAGLKSTLFAINHKSFGGKQESVICGWNLIKDRAKTQNKNCPVDSTLLNLNF